jgi:hypothetical protein
VADVFVSTVGITAGIVWLARVSFQSLFVFDRGTPLHSGLCGVSAVFKSVYPATTTREWSPHKPKLGDRPKVSSWVRLNGWSA